MRSFNLSASRSCKLRLLPLSGDACVGSDLLFPLLGDRPELPAFAVLPDRLGEDAVLALFEVPLLSFLPLSLLEEGFDFGEGLRPTLEPLGLDDLAGLFLTSSRSGDSTRAPVLFLLASSFWMPFGKGVLSTGSSWRGSAQHGVCLDLSSATV